jgi:Xaa-Pro aminopeptidase
MTAPAAVYRARRAKLAAAIERPLVILAGRARPMHYATNLSPFRAGSHYLYFGGPPIEGGAWVIEPGSDGEAGCTLMRTRSTLEDAVWIGEAPADGALAAAAGVAATRLADPSAVESLLKGRGAAFISPPCIPTLEWTASLELGPPTDEEMRAIIDMRLIKDRHELSAMRRAAEVAVIAHTAAMKTTKPGRKESDVVAAMMQVYVAHHCGVSFTPIVSVRGEVLHSDTYTNTLQGGDLLLVDSGCEEPGGYASDITRTYPVGGACTPIQRQLHGTVVRAERAGIDACLPGRRFRDVHDIAARVICEGLVEAELLKGNPGALAARFAHTLFFTHGLGHLLGMDVHDMEDFGDLAGYSPGRTRRPEFGNNFLRLDRDLEPGYVLTIEPGIYLVPAIWANDEMVRPFADVVNRPKIDALLKDRFGGIRIEDDVHVRDASAGGPEVLTASLPKDADEVGAILGTG